MIYLNYILQNHYKISNMCVMIIHEFYFIFHLQIFITRAKKKRKKRKKQSSETEK